MGTHPDPEASNNYWRSAAVPTDAKAIFSHDGASSRSEQKLQTAVVQPGVESESLLNAPPTDGPRSATTYVTASAQAELGFTTPSGSQLAATNNPAPMLQSAMTVGAKTSVAALQPLNELEGGVLGATNTASPTSLKADAPVSATPSVATDPKAVTQQIVQALVRMDGARTEVTLDPIELGRVSLIFVTKDDGVNVIVSTERSETADLLRRNSEQLQRDLTNAGYEGVELDFEDGGEEQRGQSRTDATDSPGAFPERPTQSQSLLITTGLDIRL